MCRSVLRSGSEAPDTREPPLPFLGSCSGYVLYLSDTMTRFRPELPSGRDAFGSRIQLMLYHRLLSSLLSTACPGVVSVPQLNFFEFWDEVGIDRTQKFSSSFLSRLEATGFLSIAPAHFRVQCLDDIMLAWYDVMSRLPIVEVSVDMTLEYYHQGEVGEGDGSSIGPFITASLLPRLGSSSSTATERIAQGLFGSPTLGGFRYLGSSPVRLDDALLDEYIDWKLSWWRGERPAQGVLSEFAYRCS